MKHNKILGLLGAALALTLAACGPTTSKAGSKGGKTSSSKKSTSKSSVSKVPTKSVTFDSVTLEKKTTDNKVYAKVAGTETLYGANELKWAWGLAEGEDFVYGKAAPEATDFTVAVTYEAAPANDPTAKPFTVELCITDIANIPIGVYTIYGGSSADNYAALTISSTDFQSRDAMYDYFYREDNSATGLAIEDLGPVAFNTASCVKNPDTDHTGLFVKVEGAFTKGATYTQEQVNAWNTKLDFQRMSNAGGYTKTTNTPFFWKLEGTKVILFIGLDQLVENLTASSPTQGYMTHLTANAPDPLPARFNPGKLLMSANLADLEFSFTEENVKFTLHADITKGQKDGEDEYYGAMGVICTYINAPETPDTGE